jgi:hypothetical protein
MQSTLELSCGLSSDTCNDSSVLPFGATLAEEFPQFAGERAKWSQYYTESADTYEYGWESSF